MQGQLVNSRSRVAFWQTVRSRRGAQERPPQDYRLQRQEAAPPHGKAVVRAPSGLLGATLLQRGRGSLGLLHSLLALAGEPTLRLGPGPPGSLTSDTGRGNPGLLCCPGQKDTRAWRGLGQAHQAPAPTVYQAGVPLGKRQKDELCVLTHFSQSSLARPHALPLTWDISRETITQVFV